MAFQAFDKFFCMAGRVHIERKNDSFLQRDTLWLHESSSSSPGLPVFLPISTFMSKIKDDKNN
jgi:hypothetical protein